LALRGQGEGNLPRPFILKGKEKKFWPSRGNHPLEQSFDVGSVQERRTNFITSDLMGKEGDSSREAGEERGLGGSEKGPYLLNNQWRRSKRSTTCDGGGGLYLGG